MRKYDVQELLRQEKNNVFEHMLTIILAITLGVLSSSIFNGINSNDIDIVIKSLSIVAVLFLCIIIFVLINRKRLIKVRNEKFILLTCFDVKENPKPISFNDYLFSTYVKNNWDEVIGQNVLLTKKFVNDYEKNIHTYQNYGKYYTEYFDYKVMSDLVQYSILRGISPTIPDYPRQNRNKKHIRHFVESLLYSCTVLRFVQILRNITFIDIYYKNRENLSHLYFFSMGIPLILLPDQIKENIFVEKIHQEQLELEKQIFIDGKKVSDLPAHSYLPLYIDFPNDIKISFEKSDNSKLQKILFTRSKVGSVSIEFHDRWRHSSQKSFMQTYMKPENEFSSFEEIYFEVTIDLNIRKYAYFPIVGGGEVAVDDFLSWSNKLIENIEESYDWNYYQEHITRDLFQDLRNKLDVSDWESKIEYYENFEVTKTGKFERLSRMTLSPDYLKINYALNNLVKEKDEIPIFLLEKITHRIIKLTYLDDVAIFIALEALNKLAYRIPTNLHENLISRLLDLINEGKNPTKLATLECLIEITKYITDLSLKTKVCNRIIKLHVLKNKQLFPTHSSNTLKNIYRNISQIEREELEARYLNMLNRNNEDEIIQSLLFFSCIIEFVSNEMTNMVLKTVSKINFINFKASTIEEYITFLSAIFNLKNNDLLNEDIINLHYKNIISFMSNSDDEINRVTILNLKKCGYFVYNLSSLKRDVIFFKLKRNVYVKNKNLNDLTLETICHLEDYLPGKEEEIAQMMLQK
jgi:hypothetical protein